MLRRLFLITTAISLILMPAFFFFGGDRVGIASANQDKASQTLHFPGLLPTAKRKIAVVLVNPEGRVLKPQFRGFNKDGQVLEFTNSIESIDPYQISALGFESSSVHPESLTVESQGNLLGYSLLTMTDGKKSELIPAMRDASKELVFPKLHEGKKSAKTIVIFNPNETPVDAQAIALDKNGEHIIVANLRALSAKQSIDISLVDIFDGEVLKKAETVKIIANAGLIGFQLVDNKNGDFVGLPSLKSLGEVLRFPVFVSGGALDLWTQINIYNFGNSHANVTIEAVDSNQNSLGTIDSYSISKNGVCYLNTAQAKNAMPSNTAWIRVMSDQPLGGHEVVGVVGGKGVAAVLGISESDETVTGFEAVSLNHGNTLVLYPILNFQDGAARSLAEDLDSAGEVISSITTNRFSSTQKLDSEVNINQAITSTTLAFRDPVDQVSVSANCYVGGICADAPNLHTAVDYGVGTSTTTPAFATNFGVLKRDVTYNQTSHNMGNVIVLEHLLTTGEKLLSLEAHLASKDVSGIGKRVAKSQKIGIVGCSGNAINTWCTTGGGNRHVHLELKKPDLPNSQSATTYNDLWPFGYMDQSEANQVKQQGETIDQVVHRLFKMVSEVNNQQMRVLIPYMSFSNSLPSSSNYDVYGISNQSLYSSITITPLVATSFTNLGVGGRVYNDDTQNRDIFNIPSASFSANQPRTFSGSRADLAAGDYKFFAYVNTTSQGYPLKVSILPNTSSKVIDNDSRSGYAEDAQNASDSAGYYLSARLFKGASTTNYAEWRPTLNSGRYEIWVHVPDKATAQSVSYRIYTDGSSYVTSAAINQSSNQDSWVKLTAGSAQDWTLNANAYVKLDNSTIRSVPTGQVIGADAVKFVYVGSGGSTCTDTGEPNDSFGQAYTVGCGTTTQAKVCNATDIDYYRFTPSVSGNATITLTPPSDKDYDLFVYNSSQQEVGRSEAGTGLVDSSTVPVSSGQTYYVKVIGYAGAFSTTNSYSLGISCPSGGTTPIVTSFAINNGASSTTSQNVTLNNSVTGSPTEYQASESSSFSGSSWLTYSTVPGFTLSGGTGTKTVYFRVRNSQGTSSTVSDNIDFTGGGSTCTDTGEPNDSFGQAYTVGCGTTTQAKVCNATDIDYYRFTPSVSGNATITLTPPSDKDYDLYIYNSSQQQICSSTAGTGSPDSCSVSVSGGQTYYVKVIGYAGAFSTTNTYSLGVGCPSGGTTPTVTSFAINNGASSTTSQNVTLNNSVTGSPTQCQASESSSFSGASWLNYSTAPAFTLSAGTGTKTVYFRVRNSQGTISSTVSDSISLSTAGTDNSAFVADVTIPDNTQMNPSQSFTKIWRLRNTGTTTWGSGYSFVFVGGSQMSAPSSVSVPNTAPGNTVDIPVSMIAPTTAGTYQGNWRLRNPAGQLYGIEVWVRIVVAVVQPISWEFNSTGNFQGWSCINIQAASVNSGTLFVDFAGVDPNIVGPGISAGASTYRYVQLRMASNALDSAGKIYFKTTSENFYSEDKSVSFFVNNCPLCGNASFNQYSVFMGGNAKWTGTITGIRIDPANNASSVLGTDTVGFDYIRLSPIQ